MKLEPLDKLHITGHDSPTKFTSFVSDHFVEFCKQEGLNRKATKPSEETTMKRFVESHGSYLGGDNSVYASYQSIAAWCNYNNWTFKKSDFTDSFNNGYRLDKEGHIHARRKGNLFK